MDSFTAKDGATYAFREQPGCSGCAFDAKGERTRTDDAQCSPAFRPDKRSGIWVRIGMEPVASDLAPRDALLAHIADMTAERDAARDALRELERQVFALQQQRDVLQTCLDRHQRDAADPPGYLQDAVIRAARLGALHEQRDAAIKERDELRTSLDEAAQQCRETQDRLTARKAECRELRTERDELLAALREIAGEFAPGSGRQTYGPPAEAMDRIRDVSRAAIARAEGGAA